MFNEHRPFAAWFQSDGLRKIKENDKHVHFEFQRRTLRLRKVTARLAGKFQVCYGSSQILSVFFT
jgi:hypothetical protein